MKLVTGIEAIQSGKPFKLVPDTEWTYPSSIIGQVTPRELLEKNMGNQRSTERVLDQHQFN